MTSPAPRERGHRAGHATGPDDRRGGEGISKVKAVVLLVVAVVLGVALLHVDRGPSRAAAAASTTTTSAPTTTTTTTTVPPVKPTAAVKVLVANGGTVNGAATFFTGKLSKLGWGTLPPTTTTAPASASAVYFATGQQPSANVIAAELGLQSSVVQPLSSTVPVSGTTAASVVVVVGPDLATQVPASGN